MNHIKNIAGYQFLPLSNLPLLRDALYQLADKHHIKGTILLSEEGINMGLAGESHDVQAFQSELSTLSTFHPFEFHETYSDRLPFKALKIKIKPEIVTLRQPQTSPTEMCYRAPSITPHMLKQWLDEQRDIILLDTRNDFEYRFGTFVGAINPNIEMFGELPSVIDQLDRAKPIVMFCTGGIRCEKAAIYMHKQHFTEVYQLDGGILGYFRQVGGAHYQGECFVFDERVAVDADLQVTGTAQCVGCRGPVSIAAQNTPLFLQLSLCPSCAITHRSDQVTHAKLEMAV